MKGGREMRKDEILGASPEQLRELVAVHVMGWEKRLSPDPTFWSWKLPDGTGCTEETWNLGVIGNWVENMDHAWKVVEKLTTIDGPVSVTWISHGSEGNRAIVKRMWRPGPDIVASTAPLAICRAALLAVMETSA